MTLYEECLSTIAAAAMRFYRFNGEWDRWREWSRLLWTEPL
jgi:hypothetical protein